MHVIAAKLQAFYEASSPQFVDYARQIVDNAQTLAQSLMDLGYTLDFSGYGIFSGASREGGPKHPGISLYIVQ